MMAVKTGSWLADCRLSKQTKFVSDVSLCFLSQSQTENRAA